MVIDNNDCSTFRLVAVMIVGKAEINASGSFRISNQYWRNNLYGLRSEMINSPPAANNSLKRNSLCWSNCLGLNGHSEDFRMRYLHWQELINVNYEQINFLRFLDLTELCFGEFYDNRSCERKQQSSVLSMAARWGPARWGSKWATTTTVSESQFRQGSNSALRHPLLQCVP